MYPTLDTSSISDRYLLRLRCQIFDSVYRKTDLIRANGELSRERDELRRRNRELEAGISEAAMIRDEIKRDLQVSRERVCELEAETKEKLILLSKIAETLQSTNDRLSKSTRCLNEEDGETEEYVLELAKEVESRVETLTESMEKKNKELSRSLEFLKEENRDINVLLRAALSEKQATEKQLKETAEKKRSVLMQIAERGLQKIGFGFGFGFKEPEQESSEMRNLSKDEQEDEENGLVIAIEKTIMNLRQEISQLKISLDESRLEEARLKKFTEEQAQTIAEKTVYIDKLQSQEKLLTRNVEELAKVIREGESEVRRWREACELEVEAGQREVEQRDQLISILKAEVERVRSALAISEGKLKLKEELAETAMAAEEAAEKSLRLAERRIAELLGRIEQFYRQLEEEAESTERKRGKLRYLWCWPWWRLPSAASVAATGGMSNRALLRYGA